MARMIKRTVAFPEPVYRELARRARNEGISFNELLRAILIRSMPVPGAAGYSRRPSPVVSPEVAAAVLARDSGRCVWCGSDQRPEIDHGIPASRGGSAEPDNLQVLCGPHNRQKRDRTNLEWVWGMV